VLIENLVKEELRFVSQAVVIGEQRKYLIVLLTLKLDLEKDGKLSADRLSNEAIENLKLVGITDVKTLSEAKKSAKLRQFIDQGIQNANKRTISRA
jgi:long-chain-fatty-acid--CoA ligase ACSBG